MRDPQRLTRALLFVLARAQALSESPKREVVAVRPLLEDVAEVLPSDGGARVAVDCEPNVAVVANRALLEQAIVNPTHPRLGSTLAATSRSARRA